MITDQIADLLTRIRNALQSGHPAVTVAHSKTKERIVALLADEGYLAGYQVIDEQKGKKTLKIALRYDKRGHPVIRELVRISRPGRRIYKASSDIKRFKGGLGLYVVSTSQGIVSDSKARTSGVGGELMCSVF